MTFGHEVSQDLNGRAGVNGTRERVEQRPWISEGRVAKCGMASMAFLAEIQVRASRRMGGSGNCRGRGPAR